jgi:hypothetical protein
MYINIELFNKSGLQPQDLYFLVGIKQINQDILKAMPADVLSRLEELSLISEIKGKKGDDSALNTRLNKKGKELLLKLSYEGSCDEQANILGDWLINYYKSKSGGIVKNKTEIKRRLMWFKTITNIEGNRLAVLLQSFISDTYTDDSGLTVKEFMEQNPRGVLSNMLDAVFWQPTSLFDKHKSLDKSPLYIYYEDNTEHIQQLWKSKNL